MLSGLDLKNGPHNEFSDIALDNSRALHLGGPHFCCETKEEKVQQLYLVMPCAHLRGLSLFMDHVHCTHTRMQGSYSPEPKVS